MRVYYDRDADVNLIKGKKVVVVGYGSQGHDIFRARVVDSGLEHFIFEMTGSSDKLNVFIDLMRPLGLVDVSRTGVVAISRGSTGLLG